ncbi:MAG: hypothetical protein A3F83_00920 [Candidatus Glassbacteria bacterium RIFCSPLOWO2_12_FULL_58_11]|uniref:CBM-cenC domain-containing protein n=1 Tax=Candidatus Glassbacteria bacterium RIFCSPLOWO2_12_FULL_58_11 TaxID=1817867 RepID=A0A1F5YMT8_9BACT|nr:MAG: hypothetical protein A3F83_00920 [Candidatus Glassbacteria bacterium RIFCSPLOWO2_12_FULL_58_11]
MSSKITFSAAFLSLALLAACAKEQPYPYRWVYAFGKNLSTEQGTQELLDIAKTCSEHGINGMALPGGVGEISLKSPEYVANLKKVAEFCGSHGVDVIPAMWSIGYGSGLDYDQNLAEGLPVTDALFVVKGGEARLVQDPPVSIANGGFEKIEDDFPASFEPLAARGEVVFGDHEVVHEGRTALRFEVGGAYPEESALLAQTVMVHPGRCYRLSGWVKTEGIEKGGDVFPLIVKSREGRRLQYYIPKVESTGDWKRVDLGFNSLTCDSVIVAVGAPESKGGRFWIDDLVLEEVGLVNVLRRPGTPVVVKSDKDGTRYQEGADYQEITDPQLDFLFDHDDPAIRILPAGKIREGERLRVSWYHGMTIYYSQVPVCMSEPELYDFWRSNAKMLQETLSPRYYMLNMDEIRMGGTCEACRSRGISMAQMLGETINKQVELIHEVSPQATVFIWSDMLDPNHNAGTKAGGYMKDYYYHVNESFEGSWNYVPKDLVIVCWYHEKRGLSLPHFAGLGFRTMGGAYYDADNLDNVKDWLVSLDNTPGASGIMYCSWSNKFGLLGKFGDLVSQPRR